MGYWVLREPPRDPLDDIAVEIGLTGLRLHPGNWTDPASDGGAINQFDFTWRESGHPYQVAKFAEWMDALPNGVHSTSFNYATGSPAQAAAFVAWANVALDAPPAVLSLSLGNAVVEPTRNGTRTRDWKTVGYWANLRAASPLPVDDGLNHLRLGRTTPLGIKHWECGNEADYDFVPCHRHRMPGEYSFLKPDGTYRGEPRTYARFFSAAQALMKQVDPTIKVGASVGYWEATDVVSPFPVPRVGGGTTAAWPPVMLTELRNLGTTPDFVIAHRYTTQPDMEWNTWYVRQTLRDYLGQPAGDIPEIHVTEFNWGSGWPNETRGRTTDLDNGLLLAQVYGESMQAGVSRVDWFCYLSDANSYTPTNDPWRRHHDWGLVARGPELNPATSTYPGYFLGARYPTAHAFQLMRAVLRPGDRVLRGSAVSPANSNANSLWKFVSRSPDGYYRLLLINKAGDSQPTVVDFSSLTVSHATATTWGFAQDDLQRQHALAVPPVEQVVMPVALPVTVNVSGVSVDLPSRSVTSLLINPPGFTGFVTY